MRWSAYKKSPKVSRMQSPVAPSGALWLRVYRSRNLPKSSLFQLFYKVPQNPTLITTILLVLLILVLVLVLVLFAIAITSTSTSTITSTERVKIYYYYFTIYYFTIYYSYYHYYYYYQEIYDLVASFVAPLPVLRRTLQTWVASLSPGALLSSAEDVLLVLKPDLLCSQVCGKVPECPVGRDFEPCIVQPEHRPTSSSGPVYHTGACDRGWLVHWQLSRLPTIQLDLAALDSLPARCSGLCLSLPAPPRHAGSFLSPGPLSLRALRLVSSWTSGFLASLPHALRVASRGVPVLLRVPVRSEQLMPISVWLQRTAAEFEGGLTFNCFTVEFIAKGTSF